MPTPPETPAGVVATPVAPPVAPPVLPLPPDGRTPRWAVGVAIGAAVLFIIGALVNAAVTLVAPGAYGDLADWASSPAPLARLWEATMDDNPRVWLPLVGVGFELLVGLLCMARQRRRRAIGLAGGAAFHLGLLAMGLWVWALPVLVVLGWAAAVTWPPRRPVVSPGDDEIISPGDDERLDVASSGD